MIVLFVIAAPLHLYKQPCYTFGLTRFMGHKLQPCGCNCAGDGSITGKWLVRCLSQYRQAGPIAQGEPDGSGRGL